MTTTAQPHLSRAAAFALMALILWWSVPAVEIIVPPPVRIVSQPVWPDLPAPEHQCIYEEEWIE